MEHFNNSITGGFVVTRPSLWSLFSRRSMYNHPALLFLLYVPFHLLFLVFNLPVAPLRFLFYAVHCLALFIGVRSFSKFIRNWNRWLIVFWLGLFVLMLIPGAYLEYPADPWEHFRRIFLWNNYHKMHDHVQATRLSYLWAWSWVGKTPILYHRTAVSIYAALMQWILTYHYWRFVRLIGFRKGWDLLHTVGFVVLFGTNLFSMRYYALSSAPLALAVYFSFLGLIVQGTRTSTLKLTPLLALALLAVFNHPEAILFQAIVLGLFFVYRANVLRRKHLWLAVLSLGIFAGFFLVRYFPAAYQRMELDSFTPFGSFSLWGKNRAYIETLGVHGITGLLVSPLFLQVSTFLFLVTWSPVLLLLFPPTAFAIANSFHTDATYRLFFMLPTSLPLIYGIQRLLNKSRLQTHEYKALSIGLLLILGMAAPFQFPWRGRFFFQFYRPPKERSLDYLDETAVWFSKQPYLTPLCHLVGDDPSLFVIHAHLGLESLLSSRLPPLNFTLRYIDWDKLVRYAQTNIDGRARPACGILVPDLSRLPKIRPSSVGGLSRHWPGDFADIRTHADPMILAFTPLLELNPEWQVYATPPFYTFYLPLSVPSKPKDQD